MRRPLRIALELLGPTFVATVLYSSVALVISRDLIFAKGFLMFLAFAYVFSAIPSVIFTALMEFAFARGLEGRSWRAVALASGLGALSGVAIALTLAKGFDNQRGAFSIFPALGFTAGAIVGFAIYRFSKALPNKPPESMAVKCPPSNPPQAPAMPHL